MRVPAIAIVIALAMAVLTPSAAPAPAVPTPHVSKSCGVIAKGSRDYRVKARAVRCRFAKRWVRRYFRSRSEAPGFNCVSSSGVAPFYCTKGEVKAYWAERL